MKRFKSRDLLFPIFMILIGLSLIGTTTGTLAWYAYSTRVSAGYGGTSVSRSEQLQAGLLDDARLINDETLTELKLTREEVDGHSIVFGRPGAGMISNIITTYLTLENVYASNKIPPVTSREYAVNDELTLYQALTSKDQVNNEEADTHHYVKIPLVFRVLDVNQNFVPNQDVWITAMEVTSSGNKVYRGIRTYFENVYEGTHFLVNPSSREQEVGRTKVSGLLDLDGDGFYDYDMDTHKEIVYGDYEGEVTYSDEPYAIPESDAPFVDENGVNDESGYVIRSTFISRHKQGVYVADLTSITSKYQEYDTIYTVKPNDGGSGAFAGGKPVSHTNSNGVGYTNVTVFLEGWDFVVVDRIIGTQFSLGLQFEIKRS